VRPALRGAVRGRRGDDPGLHEQHLARLSESGADRRDHLRPRSSPGTSFTTVETTFAVDADAAVAHATVRRLGSNGVVLATGDIGAITLPSDANTMKLVCGIGYADASNNPSSRNLQVAVDDIALDFCRP